MVRQINLRFQGVPNDTCEGYGPVCVHCSRPRNEHGTRGWCDATITRRPPGSRVFTTANESTCSMCGAATHTERERTDDGEWDEDCVFRPFFDGDDKDLRRPGHAGRPR